MVKVVWDIQALEDRDSIFDYIAQHNRSAAVRLDQRLEAVAVLLERFPLSGRQGRRPGFRELPVTGSPYVAAYVLQEEQVHIRRILHGARDWKRLL